MSDIYNVSKQQLNKIGGEADGLTTTYEVKKKQVEKLGGDLTKVNDIYTAELQVLEHIDGGGGGATLQEKSVSITANGTTDVMPDAGYDGMTKVSVDVAVPATPTQSKTVDITANGTEVITPDEGYDLSDVTVNVNVPSKEEETKSVTITENGTSSVTPTEGKVLSQVDITVDVPSTGSLKLAQGTRLAHSVWQEMPNYDFSEVGTDWSNMFQSVTASFDLDLDMTNVIAAANTFNSLYLTGSITIHNNQNLEDCSGMFKNWKGSKVKFDTFEHIINAKEMFYSCNNLSNLNDATASTILNFSTATNCDNMFYGTALRNMPILNVNRATSMQKMFMASGITRFNGAYMSNCTDVSQMFYNCQYLEYCAGLNCSSVKYLRNLFYNCYNLSTINFMTNLGQSTASISDSTLDLSRTAVTDESITKIVNGLYDMNQRTDGVNSGTIKLAAGHDITEEWTTTATAKGWTITT